MTWKKFQATTADLFKSLGCSAEVDEIIEGARAKHKIDVWVTFIKFGFEIKWVIECKFWNRNVTKEKVLALKSILDDVGADRGVLISKIGFQSGAINASRNTNITLTNFEEFKDIVKDELIQAALQKIEDKASYLEYALHGLFTTETINPTTIVSTPLPGIDHVSVTKAMGKLSLMRFGFDRIRLKQQPYPVEFDESGEILVANTIERFVELATSLISETEYLLQEQQDKIIFESEKHN
jgi:hypothetical protein